MVINPYLHQDIDSCFSGCEAPLIPVIIFCGQHNEEAEGSIGTWCYTTVPSIFHVDVLAGKIIGQHAYLVLLIL